MALITYTDLQDATGRTFTSAQQTVVGRLIDRVEEFLKVRLLDWTAAAATTYTFDGSGFSVLYLGRWANTVTAVTVDGSTVASTDYVVRGHYLQRKNGAVWAEGLENVSITGNWGWANAAAAPADFLMMLIQLTVALYDQQFGRALQSETVGKVSYTYVPIEKVINSETMLQSVFAKYQGAWLA